DHSAEARADLAIQLRPALVPATHLLSQRRRVGRGLAEPERQHVFARLLALLRLHRGLRFLRPYQGDTCPSRCSNRPTITSSACAFSPPSGTTRCAWCLVGATCSSCMPRTLARYCVSTERMSR